MKGIEDAELQGKNVLLRTDLNLPVEEGEPQSTVRFRRYMNTVEELSEKGARILVVAHQGRPARKDFLSLEKHSELMAENLGREVNHVQTFFGPELGDAVASMKDGDVTLLENIRFLSEELQSLGSERHAHDYFVEKMAKYFDVFVNDAFSAAHRSHGSMVGFMPLLDTYAGPIMTQELESCGKVRDDLENPLLVLGGEKPSDIIGMMEQMIDRVEKVLLGGIPGELALMLDEEDLGQKSDWIDEQGFNGKSEELKKMLEKHREKIVLPSDIRTDSGNYSVGEIPEEDMTWDIGRETQKEYIEQIEQAESVVMKGPMGAFEDYPEGTRAVVDALADSDAYTVLGGGHTSSLVHRFNHELEDFTHVSIAGGAFVRYMSGEELGVVKALEKYS